MRTLRTRPGTVRLRCLDIRLAQATSPLVRAVHQHVQPGMFEHSSNLPGLGSALVLSLAIYGIVGLVLGWIPGLSPVLRFCGIQVGP